MLCGNDGGLGVRFSFYSHPEISCKDYCHNGGPTSSRAKKATDSAAITAASLGVIGQVIGPRPTLRSVRQSGEQRVWQTNGYLPPENVTARYHLYIRNRVSIYG